MVVRRYIQPLEETLYFNPHTQRYTFDQDNHGNNLEEVDYLEYVNLCGICKRKLVFTVETGNKSIKVAQVRVDGR